METSVARVILGCACVWAVSHAFPSGAPLSSCINMLPIHGNNRKMLTFRYRILLNETSVGKRMVYGKIVGETNNDIIRGFMVQARKFHSKEPVGEFVNYPQFTKTMRCFHPSDSLTHSSSEIQRNSVLFEWRAPPYDVANVEFVATVATSFTKFWTNIRSNKFSIIDPAKNPTAKTTTTAAPSLINQGSISSDTTIFYSPNATDSTLISNLLRGNFSISLLSAINRTKLNFPSDTSGKWNQKSRH